MRTVNNAKPKLASPNNSETNISYYTDKQALPFSTNLQYYVAAEISIYAEATCMRMLKPHFTLFTGTSSQTIVPLSISMLANRHPCSYQRTIPVPTDFIRSRIPVSIRTSCRWIMTQQR